MLNMFNHSFECGTLPPSLREANISLILKKGKPSEECGSYRPILLLNVDLKILSKVLAILLENLLPLIVKEDQTGLIKGRNSYNNVRRLLNIIQLSDQKAGDGLVISLDAEKAFDQVEWSYLFFTLQKFSLGDGFIKWIKVLYPQPLAAVRTNGLRSADFVVQRGCRRGCPLSPFLFVLAIEPLAEYIRQDPLMIGLDLGGKSHKITLYADDVLLFLRNPSLSVPRLSQIMTRFAAFLGYKINLSKSEAMPLGNLQQQPDSPNPFPFKWSPAGLIYLGTVNPCFSLGLRSKKNP
uniref:Reverse transcriptase domain-containing protein n=1 Tax=Oryzias latipes TaxID=8090 RepID=A0A3P9MQD2_ORYLA